MLRCQRLATSNTTLIASLRSSLLRFSTSDDPASSNIAQGDTVRRSEGREVANAAKGDSLADADNLKYVTIQDGAQAFTGDLRSTSALGLGDGLYTHTDKWNENEGKTPMDYIRESRPIKVSGSVVASYGSENPALGCPVEYISLKGTSREHPAVCKYTGNKYYSEDWHLAH